jgi:replication factor C large subunit
MDWPSKYRPRHMEEVVGNTTVLRLMVEWGRSWTKESKPLLLYGKPGTGKTSSVYALATDLGWEVIELNASDQRTKDIILKVAGVSSVTGSLSGAARKLILLDEADNLHGTADRGGARAILDVIKSARQPVILVANDLYGIPAEVRSRCEPVQFRALPSRSIVPRLRFICSAERISCDEQALQEIAGAAGGDMRAAITMLEASAIGRNTVVESDVTTSRKDTRSTVFDLVAAVYGRARGEELMKIAYEVDETPDTLEQWIEANTVHIADPSSFATAYEWLSRSDEYIGLTFRQQYYTLWRYATALMVLGVSDAAGGIGIHARISPPERWRKMGSYRKQRTVRTSLLRKVAEGLHMSQLVLRDSYLTPVSLLAERDPGSFVREFSLDADELNMLIHDKARAQKVVREEIEREKAREKEHEAEEKEKKKRTMRKEETKEAGRAEEKKGDERTVEKKEAGLGEEKEQQPSVSPDKGVEEKTPPRTQKTLFDGFRDQ